MKRAKAMRADSTSAEAKLWQLLRNRNVIARKFRRQHAIGLWVVDFACPAIHLAIEVDGASHDAADQQAWDETKAEYLRTSGWRLLRVKNADIFASISAVETQIISAIGD